jgi:hypothetical protein
MKWNIWKMVFQIENKQEKIKIINNKKLVKFYNNLLNYNYNVYNNK